MTAITHLPFTHPVDGLVFAQASPEGATAGHRGVDWLPAAPTAPGFWYTVGRRHNAVVVSGHGDLASAAAASELRDMLNDLIEGQGNRFVVVDLGEVSTFERCAAKVLSMAADTAARRGARLSLLKVSDDIRAALNDAKASAVAPATGRGPR